MSERPYLNAILLLVSRPLCHMVHKVGFNQIEVVPIIYTIVKGFPWIIVTLYKQKDIFIKAKLGLSPLVHLTTKST